MQKKVAILMGAKGDLNTVKKAADKLVELGAQYEMHVMSAHRTPDEATAFAKNAINAGFCVIIATAGKAAHLAGVLAANTTLPVIAIPLKSSALDGLDALLSSVQMPTGIPVATVAIDNAENAAILACQMIALFDDDMRQRLEKMKCDIRDAILKDDASIQDL